MMSICQVFINGTLFSFHFFSIFLFFDFFTFLVLPRCLLLGFHQVNDFFKTFKYVQRDFEIMSTIKPPLMESVDGLLEHFSLNCWKLVRTRSKHCSNYVWTKLVEFELPFLYLLFSILRVSLKMRSTSWKSCGLTLFW